MFPGGSDEGAHRGPVVETAFQELNSRRGCWQWVLELEAEERRGPAVWPWGTRVLHCPSLAATVVQACVPGGQLVSVLGDVCVVCGPLWYCRKAVRETQ